MDRISKASSGFFSKLGLKSNSASSNSSQQSINTLGNNRRASSAGKELGSSSTVPSQSTTSLSVNQGKLDKSDSMSTVGRKLSMNNVEISKADGNLTPEKIALKIKAIQAKIEVETRYKLGAEKMLQSLGQKNVGGTNVLASTSSLASISAKGTKATSPTDPTDISSKTKTQEEITRERLAETNARISLLKTALQRYQGMHVEGLANLEELDEIGEKRTVTGSLKVNILDVKSLIGKKSSKQQEGYAVLKVDGATAGMTKIRKNMVWNEKFDVKLMKATEIEFLVYDKTDTLIALQFFKLGDLEQEILELGRKISVDGQGANSGSDADIMKNQVIVEEEIEEGVENIWDLEPSGRIHLRFKFREESATLGAKRNLERARVVRRKKQHVVNGHKFLANRFYQLMKCALCSEYLVTGMGYQCESCSYLVHKKCFDKVVTKCISRIDDAAAINKEQSNKLKHNVPHKFQTSSSMVPQWCCHCGYMLPLATAKGYEKCSHCQVCVHPECKLYVPNLCGMHIQTANFLLQEIMEVEKKKLKKDRIMSSPSQAQVTHQPLENKALPEARKLSAVDSGLVKSGVQASSLSSNDASAVKAKIPTLEDFQFIAVLGKGNFGKVMLSEEKATRKLWAIKVLKKEFILQNDEIESTKSEKRVFVTINKARHPFLVGLHSCFQTETRIYFVMEYISGGDLMLHIQRQQFSEKRAKFYAVEVLLALEYFHQNGVVYRDLKLDNILLTLDGHVKVADYGLCKEDMGYGNTTNTFCGTPEFMAPEILLERDYDRSVDWWAFGVLIYEMLLGQSPFKGTNEEEIFQAIIEEEVLYPVNMNEDAVSILQQLLTKEPSKRLGSSINDAADIKAHPYFRGVNWDDFLQKKVPPPFIPVIQHEKDVSNFDEEFTRELPVLTPINSQLSVVDQDEFKEFAYVADWLSNAHAYVENAAPAPTRTSIPPVDATKINTENEINGVEVKPISKEILVVNSHVEQQVVEEFSKNEIVNGQNADTDTNAESPQILPDKDDELPRTPPERTSSHEAFMTRDYSGFLVNTKMDLKPAISSEYQLNPLNSVVDNFYYGSQNELSSTLNKMLSLGSNNDDIITISNKGSLAVRVDQEVSPHSVAGVPDVNYTAPISSDNGLSPRNDDNISSGSSVDVSITETPADNPPNRVNTPIET